MHAIVTADREGTVMRMTKTTMMMYMTMITMTMSAKRAIGTRHPTDHATPQPPRTALAAANGCTAPGDMMNTMSVHEPVPSQP